MNYASIAPIIATTISVSGIIFQIGKHADKLDNLVNTVHAQEKREEYINHKINEIHEDLTVLKSDVKYIRQEISVHNNK